MLVISHCTAGWGSRGHAYAAPTSTVKWKISDCSALCAHTYTPEVERYVQSLKELVLQNEKVCTESSILYFTYLSFSKSFLKKHFEETLRGWNYKKTIFLVILGRKYHGTLMVFWNCSETFLFRGGERRILSYSGLSQTSCSLAIFRFLENSTSEFLGVADVLVWNKHS